MKFTSCEQHFFKNATSTSSKGMHMCPKNVALSEKHTFLKRDCFHQSSILFKRKMHVLKSHTTVLELLVFEKCHVFRIIFLQPVPSCKKYCCLSDWYALMF